MERADQVFLARCLQLARLGGVKVQPNPLVGAVVVHQGQILGEGFHQYPGGPHAEVEAIRQVQHPELLPASTLYVSLEPCNHHGKTPPCTNLIINHRIPRVVVGCVDPNPKVAGSGIAWLRAAGVEVVMADDPRPFEELNQIFFTNHLLHRPFICLKWAESGDGFIGGMNDQGKWVRTLITGLQSQRLVHKLRASYQSILIGSRTAVVDNPSLTTRFFPGPSPIRLIWNSSSQPIPGKLTIFQVPPKTLVLERNPVGSNSVAIASHSPKAVIEAAQQQGISSILVEGGRNTVQAFLDSGLFDEIYRFRNLHLNIVKGVPAPQIPPAAWKKEVRVLGQDVLEIFRPEGSRVSPQQNALSLL